VLRDFFAYYKPYKKLFMIDFGCAVISAMLELTFPFVVNRVIDTILPTGHYQTVIWVCLLLLAFYLFNMVMKYIVVYLGHKLGITIETDMRRQLFQYFQRQSFEYFDNKQTGELMSRLTSDLFEIGELAHHGPEDLFITLMSLVGAFGLMLQVHVQLAIGTVILVPILGVALAIFNKKMGRINSQVYRQLGEFNAGLSNSLSGIRVVKAFANEAHEEARFEGLIQDYRENKLKFYQTMAASSAFNYVLMRIITLIALVSGAYFTLKGELTTGQLVGFVLLANTFVKPIESINIMIETYPKGFAGFKRFRQELAKPVAVQDLPGVQPAPHFPGRAGKSSMVNLLPRFYDVTSGQVLIDGKDIREYTLASLRQQIGIVQQDVFLFDGTIRENVLYGRLDASEAEVEEAIRAAKLDQVIEQLPDGLDTAIGERGVRLSGGQKQRLSIARIFLKNPSILILDEATSALDTQTEQYIQQSFDQLTKGRTSLIIAHRLATIQHVDRIVVVTEAGVVESGSHQELLALDGHYAALYRAQFA